MGDTTISTAEKVAIRAEVREIMQKKFVEGCASLGSNPRLHKTYDATLGTTTSSASVINLVTSSDHSSISSQPLAIARSLVSMVSTSSHAGNGGNASGFSRLSHDTHVAYVPQAFTVMHWKPKEPPCFFGRSTEDVHT